MGDFTRRTTIKATSLTTQMRSLMSWNSGIIMISMKMELFIGWAVVESLPLTPTHTL